ncbi:hypothetical protein GCM10023165_37510 [Variovorax defluvii]|uniref:Uncharacterized protein n=1 Tax=Variovorax defluvii TaxID=913761 RepID=A0ABP8I2Z0_9BURK
MGDQIWSRDPATGAFDLADYKGLGAPPPACNPFDLAPLVGARVSIEGAQGVAGPVALYPGAFRFSPSTGKALPEPASTDTETWLPPFGADGTVGDAPQGLRLTDTHLALRPTLNTESPPDRQIAMPPAGNCHFLSGAFATCGSRLLAIDATQGLLFHWLPNSERWQALRPSGTQGPAPSALADEAWGLAVQDPQHATRIFLPTDTGLAIVFVNLIARTCEVRSVGTRCLAAPVLWQGRVIVPMLQRDGKLGMYALDPEGTELRRIEGPALDAADAGWARPLADRHRIVWMAPEGQLVVSRGGDKDALRFDWLPWPAGITPQLHLGSPYLSRNGQLWQQCVRQVDGRATIAFVQTGLAEPEIRPASSPRLSTGAACFQLDTRLRLAPWFEPDDCSALEADEVIVPLLESTSASTVLCVRVPHTRPPESLLASKETCTATFELQGGEHDVQFWMARMPRPWAVRPFVHAGHLYLYHPDRRRLPGWRIEP